MTTYYLRSGGGNWSAASTWSLTSGGGATGSTPTAADDLICDAGSSTATLTLDGTSGSPNLCRSFTCTGFTGTLAYGTSKYITCGDGTAGQWLLASGMTVSGTGCTLKFASTTTGNNITWAGKQPGSGSTIIFDGSGGGWQFQDAFTTGLAVSHVTGSLDTNSKSVTASYSASGTGTRSLTMGTTNWNTGSNTVGWNIADSTNFTFSGASATITIGSATQPFNGGGLSYNIVTSTGITTQTITIDQVNTFATLTTSCGAGISSQYLFGANQTVTGTWTVNGNSVINRAYVRSSVRGTARTISAATVTSQHSDWQDITAAGAASWNLSAITGNSGNCDGCTGITFTTPASQYWVPSGGTSTGSMSVTTRWANASGGTAGTGRSPLPQDTAIFDASSIDAGSRTITQDKPRIGAINWTGVTNTPAWSKTATTSFFGSITMVSGMTNSGTGVFTYEGRSSSTITTAGLTWTNAIVNDSVNGVGTLTQADNLTSSANFTNTSGTFDSSTHTSSFAAGTLTSGTVTFKTPTFSGNLTHTDATVTIGTGGGTFQGLFTKSGTGTMTVNGATTITGNIALSSTGIWALNANVTGSGGLTNTGQTVNLNNATLAYSGGSFVGAGTATAGGGIFNSSIIRAA
jgi:fibronectin-binding autotransporter adhesin